MGKTKYSSDARTRLVETAERLFYAEGIRAVGIDRIITEANVAKMTLYNHFESKDDLVLAVLKYREERVNQQFEDSIAKHQQAGAKPVDAFFLSLKEWFDSPEFRGCSFINAAVELADANHPGSKFAARHKRSFRAMLTKLISDAVGDKGATAAPEISLLIEGAIVTALVEGTSEPADIAHQAALTLIAKAKRTKEK